MTAWSPEWSVSINGAGDVTDVILSNLTITSGRRDIYSQAVAGYCTVEMINLDLSNIAVNINDSIIIKVKDSTGAYVNLFGGDITDIQVSIPASGSIGITQSIKITALGALSKLPKTLTDGVLSKDLDGVQILSILTELFFGQWNEVPAAETWAAYEPTVTWANAENSGLGEIDEGQYELHSRSSDVTDIYSLVAFLATSGLGYLYEDSSGRIGYADSLHRNNYLGNNGYVDISANTALTKSIATIIRSGDIRNKITITYKNNDQVTATDLDSISTYGSQAQNILTSIESVPDAQTQADFYLSIRAYPQAQMNSITFSLTNPEIDNSDRDNLLNIFMGLPLNITDLPANMLGGAFQGFVEGWTFSAGFNTLNITLNLSPIAYSLKAFQWPNIPSNETWTTINPTLQWINATIVA